MAGHKRNYAQPAVGRIWTRVTARQRNSELANYRKGGKYGGLEWVTRVLHRTR